MISGTFCLLLASSRGLAHRFLDPFVISTRADPGNADES